LDETKKVGRPSTKALGFIESTFTEVDKLINDLAHLTNMMHTQLIGRWQSDVEGANSYTTWNTYLKYFSENKETEARRVTPEPYADTTAFRSQCYVKYQEEVPQWQEQ
jgi:hypothetical protein